MEFGVTIITEPVVIKMIMVKFPNNINPIQMLYIINMTEDVILPISVDSIGIRIVILIESD